MNHCGRTHAISIEEKIERSLFYGFTPIDNMDGTYTFINGKDMKKMHYIMNSCRVCGITCPRLRDKKTQSFNVYCSAQCKMFKMFSYEEYKRGDHKKRPPKGKYFAFNKEDLAVKYANAITYKETKKGLHFFTPHKPKKPHHTIRLNMNLWSIHICENCGNSYYAFLYNKKCMNKKHGSARKYDSCNYKCRGELTVKNRYVKQGSLNEPLGLRDGYPYFRHNGRVTSCHRYQAQLILGRPITKDDHVHHVNMDKEDYSQKNLWITTNSEHKKAHFSYNYLSKELMDMGLVAFNPELGKYYLTTNEKENAHE